MIAGLLTATALLLQATSQPALAQSDSAPAARTLADWEQISSRLDVLSAAVMSLLNRVEAIEKRLQALSSGPGSPPAEAVASPEPAHAARAQLAVGNLVPPVPARRPVVQRDAAAEQAQSTGSAASRGSRPGVVEVDEEEIDRALERTLVETGVLLLPFGQAEIQPTFSYTRRENDVPVRFVENGTVSVGERRIRRNEFETSYALRIGLPLDAQAEFRVPYRYVDQSTVTVGPVSRNESHASGSSFGDINLGIAKTLLREGPWRPDVVARLRWNTGTGEQTDNDVVFSGGFQALAGSLSLVKRIDPLAFTGTFGYETAFEDHGIDPGDSFFTSLGTVLAVSPVASLRFAFDLDFSDNVKVDGETVPGSDDVEASLTIGGSTVLGRGVLFDLAGVIGVTDRGPDFAIRVGLPIRFDLPFRGFITNSG